MNLSDALPFLEGWDELSVVKTETIEKGVFKPVFSRECKGWVYGLDIASDDAYASLQMTYLGGTAIITPHSIFVVGATLPPPHGMYIPSYIRPSTLSTAGIFIATLITSAYPKPIKGLVRLELKLGDDSTQVTATCIISFVACEIVDEEAFIRSARRFKYGWLGWIFGAISRIPGLKYIGIPEEIKEVVKVPKKGG